MALELKINEVTWNFESGTLPDQKSHKVFVALMTKDDFGYFMVTISELYHIMKMSSISNIRKCKNFWITLQKKKMRTYV